MLWSAIGLYGGGRFFMFFYRSDSETIAAGLNAVQLVSLLLVATALAGTWWSLRRGGTDSRSLASDGGRTRTVRSAS